MESDSDAGNQWKLIEEKINNYLEKEEKQIILGDFNDCEWIDELHHEKKGYRDLVTNDMITYKPAQTAIDRVFIKKKEHHRNMVSFMIKSFYITKEIR